MLFSRNFMFINFQESLHNIWYMSTNPLKYLSFHDISYQYVHIIRTENIYLKMWYMFVPNNCCHKVLTFSNSWRTLYKHIAHLKTNVPLLWCAHTANLYHERTSNLRGWLIDTILFPSLKWGIVWYFYRINKCDAHIFKQHNKSNNLRNISNIRKNNFEFSMGAICPSEIQYWFDTFVI